MKIKDPENGYIEVIAEKTQYFIYDNLCIHLRTTDTHEDYAILTTNIDPLPSDEAAVDTNNYPEAIEFITENELGTDTGKRIKSGFCEYPVYKFNLDKMPSSDS